MAISDLFAKVFKPKPKELVELQAEGGLTGIRQAWVESVASGLTPARMATILSDCDAGDFEGFMILAEEMEERDPHYASVMGQRKRAISGVTPTVKPASESARDKEIAEAVIEHIVEHDGFSGLVEDLMDAVGKGFSVVEIDWQTDRTHWVPREFIWRPQRFFQPDKETGREIRLRDEADRIDGIPLAEYKFICHTAKLKSGHAFRGGVARLVAFSFLCKAYTLKDWVAFVELYGLPLRLGKYGQGVSKQDVATLFRAVANIGTDAAAVIPKSMDIEFVDNKSGNGTQPIFENLARYVDEQVSKAVLGQTMTSDDGSSMAQAKVHNDVRLDIAQSDARSVSGVLNRDLVTPFVKFNFGPDAPVPLLSIDIDEPEDVKALVESLTALAGAGVTFKSSEARRRLRMSDPEDGDEVFGGAPKDVKTARAIATARAEDADPYVEIDTLEAELSGDWEDVMSGILGPVLTRLEGANDFDEARRLLAEAFPLLGDQALIEGLVKAAVKARAVGEAKDG